MCLPSVQSMQGFGANSQDSDGINWLGVRYVKVSFI